MNSNYNKLEFVDVCKLKLNKVTSLQKSKIYVYITVFEMAKVIFYFHDKCFSI